MGREDRDQIYCIIYFISATFASNLHYLIVIIHFGAEITNQNEHQRVVFFVCLSSVFSGYTEHVVLETVPGRTEGYSSTR